MMISVGVKMLTFWLPLNAFWTLQAVERDMASCSED